MDEIKKRILSVINVLNQIDVCGKQNLINLYGSIEILEDSLHQLENLDNDIEKINNKEK